MHLPTTTRSTHATDERAGAGRRRAALAGLAAVAVSLSMAMGAPAAHASTAEPTLSHSYGAVMQTFPWYQGGGTCYASASASWDRAGNSLRVTSEARSTAPFHGCREKVTVKFVVGTPATGEWTIAAPSVPIPTACSVFDVTCPSTAYGNDPVANPVPAWAAPWVDHIIVELSGR
jgi:hypothetical protein